MFSALKSLGSALFLQKGPRRKPNGRRPMGKRTFSFETLEPKQMLTATVLKWTGATDNTWAGTNNWYNTDTGFDTNWVAGDIAEFTSGTVGTHTGVTPATISLPSGVSADSLDFEASGYAFSGGSLSLTSHSTFTVTVAPSVSAEIDTAIVDPSGGQTGLDIHGGGTLTLGGSSTNTYTYGTFLEDSGTTLILNKSSAIAVPVGPTNSLNIESGTTVKIEGSGGNQIGDTAGVSVYGTLDMNGNSEMIGILGGTDGVLTNTNSGTNSVLTTPDSSFLQFGGTIQDDPGTVSLYVPRPLNSSQSLGIFHEVQVATGAEGGNPSAASVSPSGVQYGSGAIDIPIASINGDALGAPWSPSLDWSSQSSFASDASVFGNGVAQSTTPQLFQLDSTTIVLTTGSNSDTFTLSGGVWQDFNYNTLTHDTSGHRFRVTDGVGNTQVFYDFDSSNTTNLRGKLDTLIDSGGNTTTFAYNGSGQISTVTRSATLHSTTTTDVYTYHYDGPHVTSITLGDTGIADTFTYYEGGNLESSIVTFNSNVIDATYLRYNSSGQVEYVFNEESYLRLLGSVNDIAGGVSEAETITDSDARPFATQYIQYLGNQVSSIAVQGAGNALYDGSDSGSGTFGVYQYTYDTSSFGDGVNSWKYSTVETLPNGTTTDTVYSNFAGETMASDVLVGSRHWITGYVYNDAGQISETINPSAVNAALNSSYAALGASGISIGSTGLVQGIDYWTTGYGEPVGYVKDTWVQDGTTSGSKAIQQYLTYSDHSAGDPSRTIWLVATSTMYSAANTSVSGATGAEETVYTYTFYSGFNQIKTIETQLPTVSDEGASVAGEGSATDTTYVFYSTEGQPIWEKDAAGFLTYMEYDPSTGVMTKQIQDAETTGLTSGTLEYDTRSLTGWSTPGSGGLNLTSSWKVDPLGRVTEYVDPNTNVTWNVYLDSSFEVRTYAGWISGSHAATAPIQAGQSHLNPA